MLSPDVMCSHVFTIEYSLTINAIMVIDYQECGISGPLPSVEMPT